MKTILKILLTVLVLCVLLLPVYNNEKKVRDEARAWRFIKPVADEIYNSRAIYEDQICIATLKGYSYSQLKISPEEVMSMLKANYPNAKTTSGKVAIVPTILSTP